MISYSNSQSTQMNGLTQTKCKVIIFIYGYGSLTVAKL